MTVAVPFRIRVPRLYCADFREIVATVELSLVVVKRSASYLSPGGKSHLLWLAAEVHGLPKYLVGAMLASDLDEDRIFPDFTNFPSSSLPSHLSVYLPGERVAEETVLRMLSSFPWSCAL